jgi:hypothetical protein
VYYTVEHGSALFVVRDTNKATSSSTAHTTDPQLLDLAATLAASSHPFKFLFYHRPFYYCGAGGLTTTPAALPYLDLAARHDVDVVFNGHSHVYSRTCRMNASHACTGSLDGTVQIEVGTVGASDARLRALNTATQTRSGYDSTGTYRTYSYACQVGNGYEATLGAHAPSSTSSSRAAARPCAPTPWATRPRSTAWSSITARRSSTGSEPRRDPARHRSAMKLRVHGGRGGACRGRRARPGDVRQALGHRGR